MMIMNRAKEAALKTAIYDVCREMELEIYSRELNRFEENSPVTWTVNWAALGSVKPATARKMADDLNKAADIAELLTSMEIVFTYEPDETIQELLDNGERERAKEIVDNWTEQYKVALETKCGDLIK